MEFQLRTLTSKDLFPVLKIISAIGVSEFKRCFESEEVRKMISEGGENVNAIGALVIFDVAGIIIERIPNCEKEINDFLADVSGLSVKEIKEISMADFAELIVTLIKKPEFVDFFKVVSKSFRSEN